MMDNGRQVKTMKKKKKGQRISETKVFLFIFFSFNSVF
jgi:hypothetical protein